MMQNTITRERSLRNISTNQSVWYENSQMFDADLFNQYILYLDRTDKTIETYCRALKQFSVWLADNNIRRPEYQDIKAYKDYVVKSHKPSTSQMYIFAVKSFFKWASWEGLYPNVAERIQGVKQTHQQKKDYFTPEQVKLILNGIDKDTPKGLRDYALIYLMVTAGLRDIEVARANVEDIRPQGSNTVLYVQGKGRLEKDASVILPPQTERILREYLASRNASPKEPLFTSISNNNNGERMTTRSISGICKAAMRQAGFNDERHTAHSFRHTAITLSVMNGGDYQEAQRFARHTNINTTMIYVHNLEDEKNTCSRRVADMISAD